MEAFIPLLNLSPSSVLLFPQAWFAFIFYPVVNSSTDPRLENLSPWLRRFVFLSLFSIAVFGTHRLFDEVSFYSSRIISFSPMCKSVCLCVHCVYVCALYIYLQRPEEGVRALGTGNTGGLSEYWELNLGLLKEQPVLSLGAISPEHSCSFCYMCILSFPGKPS